VTRRRIAVAMSGGVDSAVAAALLKEQGYDVFGVTMLLAPESGEQAADSAKKVTAKLGIPHRIIDLRHLFQEKIITPFCTEYGRGRTPNPCVACNYYVKFGALIDKAEKLGADSIATGHYARVDSATAGCRLLKGIDGSKDQSYFLYRLQQAQLCRLLLPLGEYKKSRVKQIAAGLGLANIVKPESQDICFIPGGDYRSFIAQHVLSPLGDIIDSEGNILGRHEGLAHYTVGQRQGLGLSSTQPLYVIRLDAAKNRLVVGGQEQLFTSRLWVNHLNWVAGKAPQETGGITAKVRYKSPEVLVKLNIDGDSAEVIFTKPQRAAAPGQSVVFYRGDEVLGGGIIENFKAAEEKPDESQMHADIR